MYILQFVNVHLIVRCVRTSDFSMTSNLAWHIFIHQVWQYFFFLFFLTVELWTVSVIFSSQRKRKASGKKYMNAQMSSYLKKTNLNMTNKDVIDRPVSATLICLSAHSFFPPCRFPLMYACCAAGGFLMTWGGTRWLGMLLHLLLTIPDLTWTHPSPFHLPCQQKEHKWKNEFFPTFCHRCPSFITHLWQEVGGLMWDVKARQG